MFRKLLFMAVLLGFILPPQSPKITTTNPNTEYKLYLPIINMYPVIEVFTLGYTHEWLGHISQSDCVYGYITAISPSAVYSVTLTVDVIDEQMIYTYSILPMLDATLPDQKNPFFSCYGTLTTHPPISLGDVNLVYTSLNPLNGRVIYPLTIINWEKKVAESGTTISGTVRNDSGHRLVDIRVVGIPSAGLESICEFSSDYSGYEAEVESTTLDPGKKADFSHIYCTEGVSEISAQGVAEP